MLINCMAYLRDPTVLHGIGGFVCNSNSHLIGDLFSDYSTVVDTSLASIAQTGKSSVSLPGWLHLYEKKCY
jgi:hypothetical protein